MAVILQRVVGTAREGRFYPDFAGVARSYNFYPSPPARSEDGIAAVALGLGKTVVDGGRAVRFCPKYPRHAFPASTVLGSVESSQTDFYAIDLDPARAGGSVELRQWELAAAEEDGTLSALASTYSPDDDALYDGVSRPGVRCITFAPILKHDVFPLAPILEALLQISAWGTHSPAELEFAVNLASEGESEFGFLQLRPLAVKSETEDIEIGAIAPGDALCVSSSVLGHGRIDDLSDVIVVDDERRDRRESRRIADIVAGLNAGLRSEGRGYLLVGAGRWGSSDPLLGIPVAWEQIANARVIVEAGFRDFHVTPSQGTHFFQNLTSNQVGYFTVNPQSGEGYLDWEWLREQNTRFAQGPVRHVRFERPLSVRMNGRENEGVIFKPGAPGA